jgi:hypothetical protein
MNVDTLGKFHLAFVGHIARGGLQEEKGLSRNFVVQLLCVLDIVPCEGRNQEKGRG